MERVAGHAIGAYHFLLVTIPAFRNRGHEIRHNVAFRRAVVTIHAFIPVVAGMREGLHGLLRFQRF
jgi:hypothetical protein